MKKTTDETEETAPINEPAPDLAPALTAREAQLRAIRRAMTLMQWEGVCRECPEARDWFSRDGTLRPIR